MNKSNWFGWVSGTLISSTILTFLAASESLGAESLHTSITGGPSPGSTVCALPITFTWSGSDNLTPATNLVYAFALDGTNFTEFEDWTTTTLTNLADGAHTFAVEAQDPITGMIDPTPAVVSFTLNALPPNISAVTNGAPGTTTCQITWTTDEPSTSQVEYGPTNAVYATRTNFDGSFVTGHVSLLTGLLPNVTFYYRVRSLNSCGHEAFSGYSWFTTPPDTTPPHAFFTGGPSQSSTVSTRPITFTWSGSDNFTPATNLLYAYAVDGTNFSVFGNWTTVTLTNLTDGAHTFTVEAQDQAGNIDPTPAVVSFTLNDGAFNPTNSTVINLGDHSDGIYQYTSVNIPSGVTVTFIPNAANTPVTWLVQGDVAISGTVDVSGQTPNGNSAGAAGPGGYGGGVGGPFASAGQGPGGGTNLNHSSSDGGGAYATGPLAYGNVFLIPLLGGSGGAGSLPYQDIYGDIISSGGGGGGGAILIAASGTISVNGNLYANGGTTVNPRSTYNAGGGGSGGGIRLVAAQFSGTGNLSANGGYNNSFEAGSGRIRVDSYANNYSGTLSGSVTLGSQFVIIPVAGSAAQLTITSIGGFPVSAPPTGLLATPDAVLSPQASNPINIVVGCANLPLNTLITVSVKPANGAPVSGIGYNTTGTPAASTATIPINMPRGGGLIYATATTSN